MSTRTYRVAIVEDHLLQRARTEELVSSQPDFEVVFSGESSPDFLQWLKRTPNDKRPHLLVLDLMIERQPSVDVGLVEALVRARLHIVVLSALASPPLVRNILRAGVSGIVGKRDREEDIIDALRAAVRGESWMTSELAGVIAGDADRPRLSVQEERALVLYASGLTVEQVATTMNIGRETAKQYLQRVKRKYEAEGVPIKSKLDYGRVAWVEGYVEPSFPTEHEG